MKLRDKSNSELIEMRARYLANGKHAKADEIRRELDRRKSITTATFKRRAGHIIL